MSEVSFKDFIIDFVGYKYDMRNQDLPEQLRTFCCREVVPLLEANFESLEYYLMRKKIDMT